jgi:ferredoxin
VPEKQWSPIVFFDAPRCILCYRCVRICKEGMGVGALGVVNRGVVSEITPNRGDHLECDECGMCIDICPVGALTSGVYRYKTRPWEMKHVGTACAHSNGCTTHEVFDNRIVRGITATAQDQWQFLCVKGRCAFDFVATGAVALAAHETAALEESLVKRWPWREFKTSGALGNSASSAPPALPTGGLPSGSSRAGLGTNNIVTTVPATSSACWPHCGAGRRSWPLRWTSTNESRWWWQRLGPTASSPGVPDSPTGGTIGPRLPSPGPVREDLRHTLSGGRKRGEELARLLREPQGNLSWLSSSAMPSRPGCGAWWSSAFAHQVVRVPGGYELARRDSSEVGLGRLLYQKCWRRRISTCWVVGRITEERSLAAAAFVVVRTSS